MSSDGQGIPSPTDRTLIIGNRVMFPGPHVVLQLLQDAQVNEQFTGQTKGVALHNPVSTYPSECRQDAPPPEAAVVILYVLLMLLVPHVTGHGVHADHDPMQLTGQAGLPTNQRRNCAKRMKYYMIFKSRKI